MEAPMVVDLVLMLRFSAITLLLMLALLVSLSKQKTWSANLLVLLALSLAALLLSRSTEELGWSDHTSFLIALFDVPNTILVWLFARSLLADSFEMNRFHWAIAASWCVPLWLMRFDYQGYFDIFLSIHITLLNIYGLILFLYLLFTSIRDWQNDLVEKRRRYRRFFIVGIIGMALIAIGSEVLVNHRNEDLAVTFKLIAIFPPLIAAYFWLFQTRSDVFDYRHDGALTVPAVVEDGCKIKYKKLRMKLDAEMENNQAWRESKLTIPQLAKRLGTTQHALRALINHELGYLNFRDYINQFRITAVKAAFDSPDFDTVSILVIAHENGFSTLPPFNKAFKAQVGLTPRAYRKAKNTIGC